MADLTVGLKVESNDIDALSQALQRFSTEDLNEKLAPVQNQYGDIFAASVLDAYDGLHSRGRIGTGRLRASIGYALRSGIPGYVALNDIDVGFVNSPPSYTQAYLQGTTPFPEYNPPGVGMNVPPGGSIWRMLKAWLGATQWAGLTKNLPPEPAQSADRLTKRGKPAVRRLGPSPETMLKRRLFWMQRPFRIEGFKPHPVLQMAQASPSWRRAVSDLRKDITMILLDNLGQLRFKFAGGQFRKTGEIVSGGRRIPILSPMRRGRR